jgi:hypothetical protein
MRHPENATPHRKTLTSARIVDAELKIRQTRIDSRASAGAAPGRRRAAPLSR